MGKTYRPNYAELYPDVEIGDEILKVMKQSDRKMEYQEYGRKSNRHARDKAGKVIKDENGQPILLMELEVSLDKLFENGRQFPSSIPSAAEEVYFSVYFSEIDELFSCIEKLSEYDQFLIQKIFFENMTQTKVAALVGKSQKTISRHLAAAIVNLKNLWDL